MDDSIRVLLSTLCSALLWLFGLAHAHAHAFLGVHCVARSPRAFLPPANKERASSMVRGGEAGCVAIDTRSDHLVPRGAKGKSILCMRTVGTVEPGGPYAGESVRTWCASNDGMLQVRLP